MAEVSETTSVEVPALSVRLELFVAMSHTVAVPEIVQVPEPMFSVNGPLFS